MSDDDDDQPPQEKRQRERSRSRHRVHPHAQVPQVPQIQPKVTPECDDVSDEDFTGVNLSSPSAGPPTSAEQRGRSRREERSRSRERVPPHSSSHASLQPQPVVPPSGAQQTQTLATQGSDEDSATVDPQNRVSDRSRSPQEQESSRRHGPQIQKGKKTVAEKQPCELPKAKKHKSMESDEDDEGAQNEPGTSSTSQPTEPVLPYHQGPAASTQGPTVLDNSADEDSECYDEFSAQSQDSQRTVYYPDLYVLTNDEHWTMTPETHKYAAAAGSFCFVTTENGEQQDICNLITMPCVQGSLYLNEVTNNFGIMKVEVPKGVDGQTRYMLERCMATCGRAAGTRAKMASAQEVRGYYKQFAEAKHLEYKSWFDNKVFDVIDMRKAKPKNNVTGRWVLTIETDKQGNFLKEKARWVLRGFQDKQKEYQQTDSPASSRPGFRMSCQAAAINSWNNFHIDLETAFLQGQSHGVNRDVVCQLTPEASHPPYIAARLKKPAHGMNDAPDAGGTPVTKHCLVTRADRCCYVLSCKQSRERTWNQNNSTHCHDAACEKMLDPIAGSPAAGKSVVGIIDLFVDDLFGTGGTEMERRVLARLRKDFQVGSEDWNNVTFTG